MKKANVTQGGLLYADRIIINSLIELEDYFINEKEPQFKLQMQLFLESESKFDLLSSKNKLEAYAEYMQEKTGLGAIHTMADIHSKARLSMIKYVSQGYKIMVNSNGGWCFVNEDAKIEYLADKRYTEDDINLLKFRNGSHWYAKIGYIDVVVDGEQKWNAKWQAKQKAQEFLKQLQ